MFAIVNIAGEQFKVTENTKYYVPKLEAEVEAEVTFNEVLLLSDEDNTTIGSPFVADKKVQAKVLKHLKDDKVIVFKKKRRTGYQKSNGHRQQLTQIQVTKIG